MTERRRLVLTVVVGLALVAVAVAAALSGGQVHRLAGAGATRPPLPQAAPRTDLPTPAAQASIPPAVAAAGQAYDRVLLVLLALVVVAGIGTVVVMGLRLRARVRAEREPGAEGGDPAPGLSAAEQASRAVRSGLDDLDTPGSDPRGVVIGCWLALERAAAAAGLPRRETDSPTDLVTRLLAGADVPAPTLGELAVLYRAARYAPEEVTGASRDAARQALTEVALALDRVSADPDEADRVGTGTGREPAGTVP
jgi:hypothetical protein